MRMTIRAVARRGQGDDWLTLDCNPDVAGDTNVGTGP